MSWEVESRVRSKIADIQVFLASNACTEEKLAEIDGHLEEVMAIVEASKTGGERCGKS